MFHTQQVRPTRLMELIQSSMCTYHEMLWTGHLYQRLGMEAYHSMETAKKKAKGQNISDSNQLAVP